MPWHHDNFDQSYLLSVVRSGSSPCNDSCLLVACTIRRNRLVKTDSNEARTQKIPVLTAMDLTVHTRWEVGDKQPHHNQAETPTLSTPTLQHYQLQVHHVHSSAQPTSSVHSTSNFDTTVISDDDDDDCVFLGVTTQGQYDDQKQRVRQKTCVFLGFLDTFTSASENHHPESSWLQISKQKWQQWRGISDPPWQ